MRRFWLPAMLLALSLPPAARADDVTDQIDQAVAAYRKGDLTTAVAALGAAAGLIGEKKSRAWEAVLPEPLAGWSGEPPQAQALPPALLGGGTTVSRKYRRPGDTVTVTIMADSPLVPALAGMMTSTVGTLLAGSIVLVVDGRRVLYGKDENSYQTLVDNRVLLKIEGTRGVADATLRQYLQAVKFDAIDRLAK